MNEITKHHIIISLRFDAQSLGIKQVQLYTHRDGPQAETSPLPKPIKCVPIKNVSNTELKFYDTQMKTVTN
jgi:hypothetical protein